MTWQQWLIKAREKLSYYNNDNAKLDAEVLLRYVTFVSKAKMLAFSETELINEQYVILENLLQRRIQGEPIAYLIGKREFWSLPLQVSSATIIPRPDTECLVQRALELLSSAHKEVLDLGTGCGTIALALASERPAWRIIATDYILEALCLARKNANYLNFNNVQFIASNWFKALRKRRYDLIVSNPPYIAANDHHITLGDVFFEPKKALVSDKEGFQDLITICYQASEYLAIGGWLLLEHGYQQGKVVRTLLIDAGFKNVETIKDYGANERVSQGCKFND